MKFKNVLLIYTIKRVKYFFNSNNNTYKNLFEEAFNEAAQELSDEMGYKPKK